MAALPEALDDLSAPAGGGDRVSTPKLDEGGDVKMGGLPPTDKKAEAGTAGGKKKKKAKK
jgi:hypothetical protein